MQFVIRFNVFIFSLFLSQKLDVLHPRWVSMYRLNIISLKYRDAHDSKNVRINIQRM